jgi:endonuclease IV
MVGARLEELRAILDRLQEPDRVGICLDTCHLFAAGYDRHSTTRRWPSRSAQWVCAASKPSM